ncbi:MAG: Mov34/MPN/PAD-1 family protein [Thaumarchaeota archaeon]|nr:Mov34/MPN/PAD-1 family protein [Nitrososphaerota archaeon]
MNRHFFSFATKEQKSPNDKITYIIPNSILLNTEKVLSEYADMEPSNEGLVYWGGTINKKIVHISIVIAPKTESNFGRVSTSNRSNFDVVQTLIKNKTIEIAQVHSHPNNSVDHSEGDDLWASFKIEGLVSIVVPNYCKNGMLSLTNCGVHRYMDGDFVRLSKKYVTSHFRVVNEESNFIDLRK